VFFLFPFSFTSTLFFLSLFIFLNAEMPSQKCLFFLSSSVSFSHSGDITVDEFFHRFLDFFSASPRHQETFTSDPSLMFDYRFLPNQLFPPLSYVIAFICLRLRQFGFFSLFLMRVLSSPLTEGSGFSLPFYFLSPHLSDDYLALCREGVVGRCRGFDSSSGHREYRTLPTSPSLYFPSCSPLHPFTQRWWRISTFASSSSPGLDALSRNPSHLSLSLTPPTNPFSFFPCRVLGFSALTLPMV